MTPLLEYRKSVYSQFGEEGILEFLINKLQLKNLQICEFGMNEKRNSNTFYFIENYSSFGVYIEKRSNKITSLSRSNTLIINKEIELTGENSLDSILTNTHLSKDFDILSIDVYNQDYHIWNSLTYYEPKIVIIEINPFIEPDVEYIHDGSRFSSSFLSNIKLGEKKGYKLVCMTGNLIFVKRYLLENTNLSYLLNIKEKSLYLSDAFLEPDNNRKFNFRRYITPTRIL